MFTMYMYVHACIYTVSVHNSGCIAIGLNDESHSQSVTYGPAIWVH